MTDQNSGEQRQVAELEHNFIEACLKSDVPLLDGILADNFTFTDPNGVNLTKEEWLADLSSGAFKFEAAELEDIRVNIREDVAVVQASIRVKARSKKAGYDGTYSAMDVYQKREGRWQMILSTANKVEATERPRLTKQRK